MTNPTREQIEAAYYAVERLARLATIPELHPLDEGVVEDYRDMILNILPPKPQPTMAEVEWDDGLHFLAEAESISGLKLVMLHPITDVQILCLGRGDVRYWTYYCNPEDLTPTGRRYTLTEVQDG